MNCSLTTIRRWIKAPYSGKQLEEVFKTTQEKDAVFETMTLCALITVPTNLNMILSTGYGNSNLNGSIFLHQTWLNTDSLKWKSSLYRIIYSLLVFFFFFLKGPVFKKTHNGLNWAGFWNQNLLVEMRSHLINSLLMCSDLVTSFLSSAQLIVILLIVILSFSSHLGPGREAGLISGLCPRSWCPFIFSAWHHLWTS